MMVQKGAISKCHSNVGVGVDAVAVAVARIYLSWAKLKRITLHDKRIS